MEGLTKNQKKNIKKKMKKKMKKEKENGVSQITESVKTEPIEK